MPTKRQRVEPDRWLPAREGAAGVCEAVACTYHQRLPMPAKVA